MGNKPPTVETPTTFQNFTIKHFYYSQEYTLQFLIPAIKKTICYIKYLKLHFV